MAQQSGQQPDPEDLARAKAFDAMNTIQNAVDPVTGNVYAKNRSLFDGLSANPQPYQPQYPAMDGADFGNMEPITEAQLNAPYPAQANVPLPPRGGGVDMGRINQARIDNAARVNQPAAELPAPSNPKQAQDYYSAKLDVASKSLEKDAEARMQVNIDKLKQQRSDFDTLPILGDMLELNKMTVRGPYAGNKVGTAATRMLLPEAATAMDLLKQSRLDLAAPLAKQLGVNPTDKDFQASLDRIFDADATRFSRDLQIKNLISKIERRQQLEPSVESPIDALSGGNVINWEDLP
jgi:hypothetical protein